MKPRPPHALFPRIHTWLHNHRVVTYVLIAIGLSVASLMIMLVLYYKKPVHTPASNPVAQQKKATPAPIFYSPLTGKPVANQAATTQPVTAIMIENSPDARPQSGLKDAGIVYEAIAEGGITRFLTLHQEGKPQLIGPVRSLRMYYLDWAAPYNASIAHIGGSYNALQEVRNGQYRDIDQFFNAQYYWRATDRAAPHNVYTSFEKLDALNATKGYTSSTFTGFTRSNSTATPTPTATSIDLNFSSALYNTHYDYDKTSNTYMRSIGGEASNDREGGRITPAVVVALKVDMTTVYEDGWRQSITTTGSGGAVVFQNGQVTECTWRKNDRAAPLELLAADGKTLPLARGQTWIAAIPNSGGSITWK
ncbi:MAG: DUF3048 domain-containing protein [Candidatus Saccharimonas sp.]